MSRAKPGKMETETGGMMDEVIPKYYPELGDRAESGRGVKGLGGQKKKKSPVYSFKTYLTI